MQHLIYRVALDGKLFLAPLVKEKIERVLDVGCGTGEYALVSEDLMLQTMTAGAKKRWKSWQKAKCGS